MESLYQSVMCNFDNLYEAYKKSHRGKANTQYVIRFDAYKMRNLHKLLSLLENKQWDEIIKYYRFNVYEPKERIIDAMEFEGRIVQHVLCDKILKPYFENRVIYANSACRENKGTDFALNLTKQYLVKFFKHYENGYCLKMDIHHYFPSIDKEILKGLIESFPDEEIKEFLFYLVDHCPDEHGIPIGNQVSQWFALYYMDKVDRLIKEKYSMKCYVRYMDDVIVIQHNKEVLNNLFAAIKKMLKEELHLELNGKSQLISLHKGFDFLSWRFRPVENHKILMTIVNNKKPLRIKKAKEINKKYRRKELTQREVYYRHLNLQSNFKKGNAHGVQLKYIGYEDKKHKRFKGGIYNIYPHLDHGKYVPPKKNV